MRDSALASTRAPPTQTAQPICHSAILDSAWLNASSTQTAQLIGHFAILDNALNAAPTQTAQQTGHSAMWDSAWLNAPPTQIVRILVSHTAFLEHAVNAISLRFRVKPGRAAVTSCAMLGIAKHALLRSLWMTVRLNLPPFRTPSVQIKLHNVNAAASTTTRAPPTQIVQVVCHSAQTDNAEHAKSMRFRVLPVRAQTFLRDNLAKDLSCVFAQPQRLRPLFALFALVLLKTMALLPRRAVSYWRPISTKTRML